MTTQLPSGDPLLGVLIENPGRQPLALLEPGRDPLRLGPGGVFGELALIEQAPRLASVAAETDCSLLPINRASFLALVESSPEFAASLSNALAERLRRLTARLV